MQIGKYYRLNSNIRASKVRLINEDGKQVGIVDLVSAINQAKEKGLDLIEVASSAQPPVVRISDFKKFKYEESKKERTSKKKTRQAGSKEIWLGPLISENDFKTRMNLAKTFLSNGDRVKLTVKFGGREIVHSEFGYQVLEKAEKFLEDVAEKDSEPKMMGRNLSFSLKAIKNKQKNEAKKQ